MWWCVPDTGQGAPGCRLSNGWDKPWADGAGFRLCFAFYSFHLSWKPLIRGTGTHTDTPLRLAPGWGGVAGPEEDGAA